MGMLVDGQWVDRWYDTSKTKGRFIRSVAGFRSWVTPDGAAGPSGGGGFPAASGRYHLYVSLACPWAHRTLIMRRLKGLEAHVGVSVVHHYMGAEGWTFEPGDGVIADPVASASRLHQVYTRAEPSFTGRVTVPVLWDLEGDTIVSNESSEIIRMFNHAFDGLEGVRGDRDYYPADLRGQIDQVNERVYETLNNGVYKAGFATSQEAYREAVDPLFDTLEWLEDRLGSSRYLMGDRLTEADIRLFTTLIRFDAVYHVHFKCSRHRLADFPNLWAYTRELYQLPEVRSTVDFHHIRHHYFGSHPTINPSGIVPVAPELDYDAPHGREAMVVPYQRKTAVI